MKVIILASSLSIYLKVNYKTNAKTFCIEKTSKIECPFLELLLKDKIDTGQRGEGGLDRTHVEPWLGEDHTMRHFQYL